MLMNIWIGPNVCYLMAVVVETAIAVTDVRCEGKNGTKDDS